MHTPQQAPSGARLGGEGATIKLRLEGATAVSFLQMPPMGNRALWETHSRLRFGRRFTHGEAFPIAVTVWLWQEKSRAAFLKSDGQR